MPIAYALLFIGIVLGDCLFTVQLVSTARCSFTGEGCHVLEHFYQHWVPIGQRISSKKPSGFSTKFLASARGWSRTMAIRILWKYPFMAGERGKLLALCIFGWTSCRGAIIWNS